MTLKNKLWIGMSALALAALGLTGALAAGHADCGPACSKAECVRTCPKEGPCPLCPPCSSRPTRSIVL